MAEEISPKQRGYRKGQSGNPAGRPKGVPNKATQAIKELARKLLSTKEYLDNLQKAVEQRKCHPSIEAMLHHYAYGKPKEVVQVEGSESLAEILTAAMARKGGPDGDSE